MKDLGLLVLRLNFGLTMLLAHGWGKLTGFSQIAPQFPDPLGVGSEISLALAVFAEALCSLLLALGLFTRAALVPLMITMSVAFFIIHSNDPWQKRELSFLYLSTFFGLFLCGPGRFSIGQILQLSLRSEKSWLRFWLT